MNQNQRTPNPADHEHAEIKMLFRITNELQEFNKEAERRMTELEKSERANAEIFKSLRSDINLLAKSIDGMSQKIEDIYLRPLKTLEKIKIGVAVSVITAIIMGLGIISQ